MSTSICSKERKVVNLQFSTQKDKLPCPQFGMKPGWIILTSEICPDVRVSVCIQRAGPSTTLEDLTRQRQLDPYGSFLYETLESLLKKVCSDPSAKHQVS